MKTLRWTARLALVACLVSTDALAAPTPDHLQCYKIKDDLAKTAYSATLTPDNPIFAAAPGCTFKTPAKLVCVNTVKSAVSPAPPGASPGNDPGTFLCYKVKCPATTATTTFTDQFGTHNIIAGKAGLLCAPVDTGSVTTTTLPSGCATAADCPGMDSECSVRSCTMGTCGFSNTAAGVPLMGQTPGDCQKLVCDGMGSVASTADNTDLPVDDGNQCTGETCVAGTPSHPSAAPGTACSQGMGSVCNGSGSCVQCNAASDCPGMDGECSYRSCSMNTCGTAYAPMGTACNQNGGTACDGAGNCL